MATNATLLALQAQVAALTGFVQTLTGEVQSLKGLMLRPAAAGSAPAAAGASPAASTASGKKPRRSHEEVEAAKAAKALKPKRAATAWPAFQKRFSDLMAADETLRATYKAWETDPATPPALLAKALVKAKTDEAKQTIRAKGVKPTKMGFAAHLKDTNDEIWASFNAAFVPTPKSSPALVAAPAPAAPKPTPALPVSPVAAPKPAAKRAAAKKPSAVAAGYKRVVQDGRSYLVKGTDAYLDLNGNCGTRMGEYDPETDFILLDEEEFVDAAE